MASRIIKMLLPGIYRGIQKMVEWSRANVEIKPAKIDEDVQIEIKPMKVDLLKHKMLVKAQSCALGNGHDMTNIKYLSRV